MLQTGRATARPFLVYIPPLWHKPRMMAALYYLSLMCLVPAALLALYYAAIERTATSATLGVLLARLTALLEWLAWSGLIAVACALILLAVGGGLPRFRPAAAAMLLIFALLSFATIWRIGALTRNSGDRPFLILCALSMAGSGYVIWHA
jgi:hypothetical protein